MLLRRIYRRLAGVWYKLVTLKSSPRKIALGFALGIFLSFTPTLGVQTAMAIGLAALLRINPISAALGVYLTNPVTAVPIYAVCYTIGAGLLGVSQHAVQHVGPQKEGGFLLRVLSLGKSGLVWMGVEMAGAVTLGLPSAVAAYFAALAGIVNFRRARLNRRIERMHRRIAEQADTPQREQPSRDAHRVPGARRDEGPVRS